MDVRQALLHDAKQRCFQILGGAVAASQARPIRRVFLSLGNFSFGFKTRASARIRFDLTSRLKSFSIEELYRRGSPYLHTLIRLKSQLKG